MWLLLGALVAGYSQETSIAERLGYPKGSKLLILHADDLGVSHSQNLAGMSAFEQRAVNSGSIMVPCPWFPEIAAYARTHRNQDLGVHLTLNSEWEYYKWGPVSSRDSVASLLNSSGYFYSSVDSLAKNGKPEEVEKELRNQVKKALATGVDVTHLDTHMGAVVSRPDFLAAYMRVGKDFGLPVLLDKRIFDLDLPDVKALLSEQTVVLDQIFMESPEQFQNGAAAYYTAVLRKLPPGLNLLIVHLAKDNEEMRAVTTDHPDYGATWRQADYDFITSQTCRDILNEEAIILVTWRELRDKITRSGKVDNNE